MRALQTATVLDFLRPTHQINTVKRFQKSQRPKFKFFANVAQIDLEKYDATKSFCSVAPKLLNDSFTSQAMLSGKYRKEITNS